MAEAAVRIPSLVTTGTLVGVLVLTLLATGAFVLRVLANRYSKTALRQQADFWFLVAALIFVWGGFIELACAAGIGGVNYTNLPPKEAGILFVKVEWANAFLFAPASTFVKLAVLALYKRLFVRPKFRLICNVIMALSATWGLSYVIGQFLTEDPVFGAWEGGHLRLNYFAFNTAIAAAGPALDLITLCLPIPIIVTLQTSFSQKIKIISIFWLGAFVVVCAVLRLAFELKSVRVSAQENSAESYNLELLVDLFARLEPAAAVIAACLPTLGPFFSRNRMLESLIRSVRSVMSLTSQKSDGSAKSSGQGTKTAAAASNRHTRRNSDAGRALKSDNGIELVNATRDWESSTNSVNKSRTSHSDGDMSAHIGGSNNIRV